MRRLASGLVLTVVAIVAGAATVDAFRSALKPEPARAEPRPRAIEGLSLMSGRLRWTDARCRLHVTSPATLQEPRPPRRIRCDAGLRATGGVVRGLSPRTTLRSPSGRVVARATGHGLRVVKDGRAVLLPIRRAHALAWSPDERWLAAAGRHELFVVRILNRDMRIRRLPIRATHIAWVA